MKQIKRLNCNREEYTEIRCSNEEVLGKIIPSKTPPLSCRELAIEIIDWIKFYDLKENTAFVQGYETSDVAIITPKGDYLFVHDFARKALPYQPNIKKNYYEHEEVPLLPQTKPQAWKFYNEARNLAGVLEIKRKDLRKMIKPENIPRKVNLLADPSIYKLNGVKKEIMEFLIGSEDLFYEYITQINKFTSQRLGKLEEQLNFPPIFLTKAKNEMPSFEIIRMNGILPKGVYFLAGGYIHDHDYSFLYRNKSPFKEKKQKGTLQIKPQKNKKELVYISKEEVGEEEFERLKKLVESTKKNKKIIKPMKGEEGKFEFY